MGKQDVNRRIGLVTQLRFRDTQQRNLIKSAAVKADTSMNSFIRLAAEKAAREMLRKEQDDKS